VNKSMLAGIGIGVAAALGVAAVAGLNVLDRGPQYAQVVSSTPIKETVKTPRQECRNVTVTHRRPVQDENRIAGSVLGAVAGRFITFDTTGLDFALTGLFVVLFIEQVKNPQNRMSGIIGLVCSAAALAVFGADNLVIPAMVLVLIVLLLGRKKL
jgi:hypothetical protein